MNIEFTEQDFTKLNDLIQQTPFKYAYPLFQFFQGKISEASKAQQETTAPKSKKVKADGNQTDGQ